MAKIKNTAKPEKEIKKKKKFKAKHFPCSYCSKTFQERGNRDQHMLLHSSEKPFACTLCSHTCKTKKYLARHVRVVHNPPTSYKCEYCNKMFHYKCVLDKHRVIHTNARPYKCKDCGKGFNSGYSLKSHVLIHKDLKPFKCKYCEYACRDNSTLRRHQERHRGIVTKYHCNICDKEFSKKQTLQYHVAEVHMKVNLKKIPCEQCDSMFRTNKTLMIHIEVKHNRKFATNCEICGLKLANKYNMNTHLMTHVDVKPYKCAFIGCEKRYKSKSTLQKHTIIHYPERQFPCKICGKKFTRKIRLKKHKKQHVVRVKNVQCDYCGVHFYNKNYLTLHIRRKHCGRKIKYICDMCDFASGNKPGLIVHIKSHYMKLNKECPICAKKYKEHKWLKLHLWQAHKVKESNVSATFETDIKVEPLDVDGTPEFELFEIEKEEIVDELQSLNNYTNKEQNIATDTITDKSNVGEEANESIHLNADSEILQDSEISRSNETFPTVVLEKNNTQIPRHTTVVLQDIIKENTRKSAKEVFVNENVICSHNATDKIVNTDNVIIESENLGNDDNEKSIPFSNGVLTDNDVANIKDIENDDQQNLDINSTKSVKKIDSFKTANGKYSQTETLIHKDNSKSQAHIKSKLKERKIRVKKINNLSNLNIRRSKRKNLAQIKAALLEHSEDDKGINTEISSETEDKEGLEYSRAVLSEDITRFMTQKKNKDSSEMNFDDFFIKHIVERQDETSKNTLEIDKDCESYAKDYIGKLLAKRRNENEVKFIEKTRQQYNERIRRAKKLRPEKIAIKYLDKKCISNAESNEVDKNKVIQDIDIENERNSHSETQNVIKYDDKNEKNNDLKVTEEKDLNFVEKSTKNLIQTNKDVEDELSHNTDTILTGEKVTNRFRLRSDSNKKSFDDQLSNNVETKNVEEYRKIKLNTHQCYVCFKLFPSKEELLDHCKDHFEVCNSTILKKCPFCDFATKNNIVQHMKIEHDVDITIPSTRIIDKKSDNGPGYCYKVDSATISDIDVIPSVKNLNKQAYIALDKKNRKLKDTGIAKTKLIKKGNEWIVERKMTKIDNVDDFILPEFDVDEILSIKIDTNDYLSRMKKLYRLANKYKRKMLFPCENCDKICQTLSALKLHYRRHDPKSKPFKKKVWKHKIKDTVQPRKNVTDIDYGNKKYARVVEIDKNNAPIDNKTNNNRYEKPKPIVNKHKCDPQLIKFYETNIQGGDIEFWQFLKIFNKMSRENVNDFDDLDERHEFGIHFNNKKADTDTENTTDISNTKMKDNNKRNITNNIAKYRTKQTANIANSKFKRTVRISKKDYQKRNDLKQRLREKIAKESLKTV